MIKMTSITSLLFMLLTIPGFSQAETADKLPKISSMAIHHQGELTRYFAATGKGLYSSNDNGLTWTIASEGGLPATMVAEPIPGELYSFIVGQGLLRLDKESNQWQPINNRFGSQVLFDISTEPGNPDKLIGLNQFGKLIISENSGQDWHGVEGAYKPGNEAEARGQALFQKNCQACHGVDGVGETYTIQALTEKDYIRAPAMNDSEHAWHHTDEALTKTILEGSPRTERMIAWKDAGLNEEDASDLISYIKGLWTQRELDCQGPKHMNCNQ